MHILLISSDPYISSIRIKSNKFKQVLSNSAKSLLILPLTDSVIDSDSDTEMYLNQSFSEINLTD